jgi:polysaccharide export outer membrane protein
MRALFLDEVLASVGGVQTGDDYAIVRIYRDGTLYQVPVSELYSDRGLRRIRLIGGDSIFVDTTFNLDRAQGYFEEQIQRAEFTRRARSDALAELQSEISLRRNALSDLRDNFRSRLELGAIEQDHVFIIGEVTSPGRFALPFNNTASVADALMENGGVSPETGNPAHIYVLRGSTDPRDISAITAYRLNARNAVHFILATQMELRPNDIIFVAEQPVTRWSRTINQITPSIIGLGTRAINN